MPRKLSRPPSCHDNFLKSPLREKVLRLTVPKQKTLGTALHAMHIEVVPKTARARLMAFYAYDPVTKRIVKIEHKK